MYKCIIDEDTGAQLSLTLTFSQPPQLHIYTVEISTKFEVNHSPFHKRMNLCTRVQFGALNINRYRAISKTHVAAMVAILLSIITEFAMAP